MPHPDVVCAIGEKLVARALANLLANAAQEGPYSRKVLGTDYAHLPGAVLAAVAIADQPEASLQFR